MWDGLDSSALSILSHPAVPDPPRKHLSTPIQNSVPVTLLSKLYYIINGIKLHKVYHSESNRVVFCPLISYCQIDTRISMKISRTLSHNLNSLKNVFRQIIGKIFLKKLPHGKSKDGHLKVIISIHWKDRNKQNLIYLDLICCSTYQLNSLMAALHNHLLI